MNVQWIDKSPSRVLRRFFQSFAGFGALCLVVSACTSTQHFEPYKPAAVRSSVSVPRDVACSFTDQYPERKNCCVMKIYVTKESVDAAYDKLLAEYQFSKTPRPYDEEIQATPDLDHGHQHFASPGDAYRLKGIVVPNSDPALYRGLWMGVELDWVNSSSTKVSATYCEIGGRAMEAQLSWHRAVQGSITATLPPTSKP